MKDYQIDIMANEIALKEELIALRDWKEKAIPFLEQSLGIYKLNPTASRDEEKIDQLTKLLEDK